MALGYHEVNPDTLEVSTWDANGAVTTMTQTEAFGHDYFQITQRGQLRLVNPTNVFDNYQLGRQGPISVEVTEGNILQITSQTLAGNINRNLTGTTVQRFSGDIPITAIDGSKVTLHIDEADMHRRGYRWFMVDHTDPYGNDYQLAEQRMLGTMTVAEYIAANPSINRLADSVEAVDAGIKYYLLKKFHSEIEALKGNIPGPDGTPTDDSSDIAAYLINIARNSLNYYSSFLFNG